MIFYKEIIIFEIIRGYIYENYLIVSYLEFLLVVWLIIMYGSFCVEIEEVVWA